MIDAAWTRFAFPTWWHYDVLRRLEYLRCAALAARRASASPRRSSWSCRSATTTAGGRSKPDTAARCWSRRTRARANRAGGTPPCLESAGLVFRTRPTLMLSASASGRCSRAASRAAPATNRPMSRHARRFRSVITVGSEDNGGDTDRAIEPSLFGGTFHSARRGGRSEAHLAAGITQDSRWCIR
jgi:hypothetical protein